MEKYDKATIDEKAVSRRLEILFKHSNMKIQERLFNATDCRSEINIGSRASKPEKLYLFFPLLNIGSPKAKI
jgi:hypothetical protein